MPDQLWGTFSVRDHLRPRAFVADVLLYDQLVVPYPPDAEQRKHWRSQHWAPDRLERKLEILDKKELVRRAPWSEWKRELFRQRLDAATQVAGESAQVRDRRAAQSDREIAESCTRMVLCDDVLGLGSERDVEYVKRLPGDYVEAVAAYGSYRAFTDDTRPDGTPQPAAAGEGVQLAIFGWELLVPEDARRSDDDLLRRAVKLAARDDLREKRLAFHEWRRKLQSRGVTDEDALADLERRLDAYRDATRRVAGKKRAVNVFTVGGITVSAAAAFVFPPAAAAAPFIASARFAADQWLPDRPPGKEAAAVAMFYDARRHFGWKFRRARA